MTQHAVELLGLESGEVMRAELCEPREGECCPVTCDVIGAEAAGTVPHVPKGVRSPLAAFPDLTCMQLPCGHRFEGTALIVHFLRSAMQCPMCRAGVPERMDPIRSLRGERWLLAATRSIAMVDVANATAHEDRNMILLLELLQQEAMEAAGVLGIAALYDARDQRPLLVHVALYGGSGGLLPRIIMPFRMSSSRNTALIEYSLERRYLRELTAAAADFGATSLSVEFIGMHDLERVPMGGFDERLPIGSHLIEGMDFTIEIRCSPDGEFMRFVYYPAPTMLIRLVMDSESEIDGASVDLPFLVLQ